MKIRLVSDLHIDINKTMNFGFLSEEQDLLLVAGDIAGGYKEESKMVEKLPSPCICIGGNHLGYNRPSKYFFDEFGFPANYGTKEWCIKELRNSDGPKYYLENEWIEFGGKIIYAGTMYTDFRLYGKEHEKICKDTAEIWMNDFKYVYTDCIYQGQRTVKPVFADDYIAWHKKFMRGLRKCLKETEGDVIVLAHFAPSLKSISKTYINQRPSFSQPGYWLNGGYAVDLEKFLKKNSRIKLFCHGHVHSPFDYMIGECRVVAAPYGYFGHEQPVLPEEYKGKIIEV